MLPFALLAYVALVAAVPSHAATATGSSLIPTETSGSGLTRHMMRKRSWRSPSPVIATPLHRPARRQSTPSQVAQPDPSCWTRNRIDTNTKKAGLGWTSDSGDRFEDFTDIEGSVIGWTYDWNSHIVPGTPLDKLDFVPMAWGPGSASGFADDSSEFDCLGVSHLLSFNEPDQQFSAGGSQTSPGDAAAAHQSIFNSTLAASYRIGSPAVARGSKWWMEEWVRACEGKCVFDFVPLHFYGLEADDMITYIEDFYTTFGRPIWVTEYACMDFGGPTVVCTLEQTMEFNRKIIDYMYNSPIVERYAAFGTFTSWASGGNPNGMLNQDGSINDLGRLYATST